MKGITKTALTPPIPNAHAHATSNGVSSNSNPFAPLYIMKNEFKDTVPPTNTGNRYFVLLKLCGDLNINCLIVAYNVLEIIAENTGEINQDNTIPLTPPT